MFGTQVEPLLRKMIILCCRSLLFTVVLAMLTWLSHLALSLFPHLGSSLSAALLQLSSGNGMGIALLVYFVYCMITSGEGNITWNRNSLSFTCPGLGCCISIPLNNHSQPLRFRLDRAVLENLEFPLGVKDGTIILLLVLLCFLSVACTPCTLYTMPRDREGLRGAQRRLQEEEEEEEGRTESASTRVCTACHREERNQNQRNRHQVCTACHGERRDQNQRNRHQVCTACHGERRNQNQRNRHLVCTACHGERRNQEQRNRHHVCTACHGEKRSPKGSQCFHTDCHRARAAQASSSCPRSEEEVQEQIHANSD
ncbi:uncharacterized protein LOC108962424 [Serinus canaria]|uniref:uncharacterized protein LOC108962424 n=1 Tax=Serinus canaria TaxID=9135 RepID=UPI0021CC9DE2|nr:uncharacterized protein LOC108962424 [Serinus canaria]